MIRARLLVQEQQCPMSNGVTMVALIGDQISDTSLRWASASPSMYRCVVWIDR
jgi:hypothetical protein